MTWRGEYGSLGDAMRGGWIPNWSLVGGGFGWGWVNRWVDGLIVQRIIDGRDEWAEGQLDGWIRMEGFVCGWTDGWLDQSSKCSNDDLLEWTDERLIRLNGGMTS